MTIIRNLGVGLIFFLTLIVIGDSQNNINANDALNSFAINLLRETNSEAGESLNIAIAPFTIWTLLTIISEGARGTTAKQLERVLNIPNDKNQFRNVYRNLANNLLQPADGVNLLISNAIFTTSDQTLNSSFQQVSRKFYNVDVQPTNFRNGPAALNLINSYISRATKNRINNFILSSDLVDAQILMTSALYFKGEWKLPFNQTATTKEAFFDEKQNRRGTVDMMYQLGVFPFARIPEIKALAVELPYGKGEKMSMIVLLPFRDETIRSVLNALSKMRFTQIIETLETAEQDFVDEDVQVNIPRFTVKSDLSLNIVLDKMGIQDLFNEAKADLLGIFPHYLHVSRLIQRAEIEVNEQGTVATAAAGAAFTLKIPPPRFRANKPFLYFIIEKRTRSVIFAGKISNPNAI